MPTTTKCKGTNTADFCSPARKTNIFWIGGDYNFTPAFNLAAAFYDIAPRASKDYAVSPEGKLTGQGDGHIYQFSVLADYHFTKRTDLYAGFLYSQYKGNNYPQNPAYTAANNVNSSNYLYAVGLRTKF
jgi:predicted porin